MDSSSHQRSQRARTAVGASNDISPKDQFRTMGDTVTDDMRRIDQLETALVSQQAEIERLRSDLATVTDAGTAHAPNPDDGVEGGRAQRSSRRTMLKGGAIAAGAALAGAVAAPQTAAAADGGNMLIGRQNTSPAGNTRIRTPSPGGLLSNVNILTVTDNASSSSYEAAIGGTAQGDRVTNGMYAFTSARTNSDVTTGHAIVARKTSGGRSAIYMPPSASAPTNDTYQHGRGEMRVDSSGILWYCVVSGTPGTWRRLAASSSSGAVHAIDPKRTYDSRFDDGPLTGGGERVISVADGIDAVTGDVIAFNIVPLGATAIFFNLTITETTGSGFLQLAPGNASVVTASTINWASADLSAANASFSTLDDARQVKILSGGSGSTEFIIDITGYTL